MRTLDSRLRELVESTEYQKDFEKVKKSIFLLREQKKYIKGTPIIVFIKVDLIKSQNAGVIHREKIPLKEVQTLLKKGNVNGQYIMIPAVYSDFKAKYGLEYFFDPTQSYHGFNPFHDIPLVAHLPLNAGTKVPMTVDISYPSKILERKFKAMIRSLKEMWKLKEERKERYSDEEVYKVKKLVQKRLGDTAIFRELYPQHKDFKFTRDYVIGGDEVGKDYQRTKRLIKRAKERKT